jgi:hypothetical protein
MAFPHLLRNAYSDLATSTRERHVTSASSVFRRLVAVMSAFAGTAYGVTAAAQSPAPAPAAQAAPAAQTTSACGSQPFCYDASDFVATITDFRTTSQGGYKIIDVTLRFFNRTTTPLGLGYAAGSGLATDDRGNRYAVYGANGLRGMGVVNGSTFDPKFVIRAGGFGDSRFELMFAPGQQVVGLTFEFDLTVNEINSVEGNQHTLGSEFPLQFKGLTNGSTGPAVPGQETSTAAGQVSGAAAQNPPPCGSAGAAVSNAAANATTAAASIGSLFGAKKPASTTAAAAPCTPATPRAASATTAASAATTPAHPATAAAAATTKTPAPTTPTTTSVAKPTVAKVPAPPVKDTSVVANPVKPPAR